MKKIILSVFMLGVLFMIVGSVSAVHTSSVAVSPSGWLKNNTVTPLTFTISNTGGSDISQVTITRPDSGFTDPTCNDVAGWVKTPGTTFCRWDATAGQNLLAGQSKDFGLSLTTGTFGEYNWSVRTMDIASSILEKFIPIKVQTIQSAINAATAGATINVPAGIYTEYLYINKPLTLQGVGVENTIIDMSSLGNPSVRKKVILVDITSGDVTIDGFEIILGDNMDGIESKGSDFSSTLTISNNKITGYGDATCNDLEDFGIIIQDTETDVVISTNEINTNCNPILLERAEGESDISWNTLYAKENSAGIFIMTLYGVDVTALQNIHDNTITISEAGTGGIGIRTSPSWTVASNGKFTNINIEDNTITGIDSGNNYGIKILNDKNTAPETAVIGGTIISRNTITGFAGIGIILGGYVVDTNINDNTISGVDTGIKVDKGSTTDKYPIGTLINNNVITGCLTYRLNWLGSTLLNAENNDWGVTIYDAIDALIEGNVDFDPWWYCSYDCPDTTAPVITFNNAPYFSSSNVITINATITDDRDVASYVLDFGDSSNLTTVNVTGNHDLSASVNVTHTYSGNGDWTVSLTAKDAAGHSVTKTTSVSVDNTNYDWVISLNTGWNLISFPLIPTDSEGNVNTGLQNVLSSIAYAIPYEGTSSYEIMQYNAVTRTWNKARPLATIGTGFTGSLTSIVPGYAYWIKVSEDTVLKGFGAETDEWQMPPSVDLGSSWNLVGKFGDNAVLKSISTENLVFDNELKSLGDFPVMHDGDFLDDGLDSFERYEGYWALMPGNNGNPITYTVSVADYE